MEVTTHYGCFLPSDTLWVSKFRQKISPQFMAEKTHRKKGGFLESSRHRRWIHGPRRDRSSRKTIREALDFVTQEITRTVLEGKVVKLTGFGTFELRKRAERLGATPRPASLFSSRAIAWWSFPRPGSSGKRGRTRTIRSKSVRLESRTLEGACQTMRKKTLF